jgi:hypothetical protein
VSEGGGGEWLRSRLSNGITDGFLFFCLFIIKSILETIIMIAFGNLD